MIAGKHDRWKGRPLGETGRWLAYTLRRRSAMEGRMTDRSGGDGT